MLCKFFKPDYGLICTDCEKLLSKWLRFGFLFGWAFKNSVDSFDIKSTYEWICNVVSLSLVCFSTWSEWMNENGYT